MPPKKHAKPSLSAGAQPFQPAVKPSGQAEERKSFEETEEQKKLQENWFRISLVMVDVVPRVTSF